MYYKKFSDREMQVIRSAISKYKEEYKVIAGRNNPQKGDAGYDNYKLTEKIEKKLVHCFYLSRK